MPGLQGFNDFVEERNLRHFRNPVLRRIGKDCGFDFDHRTRKDEMISKILSSGKPIDPSYWTKAPKVYGNDEKHPATGAAVPETTQADVEQEKATYIAEMKNTKSFFAIRAMAKAAGVEVQKGDTKAVLIEKTEEVL